MHLYIRKRYIRCAIKEANLQQKGVRDRVASSSASARGGVVLPMPPRLSSYRCRDCGCQCSISLRTLRVDIHMDTPPSPARFLQTRARYNYNPNVKLLSSLIRFHAQRIAAGFFVCFLAVELTILLAVEFSPHCTSIVQKKRGGAGIEYARRLYACAIIGPVAVRRRARFRTRVETQQSASI